MSNIEKVVARLCLQAAHQRQKKYAGDTCIDVQYKVWGDGLAQQSAYRSPSCWYA